MKRVHNVPKGRSLKLAKKWKGRNKVIDVLPDGINYDIHPIDKRNTLRSGGRSEIVHGSQLKLIPYPHVTEDESKTATTELNRKRKRNHLVNPSPPLPTSSSTTVHNDNQTSAMHPDYREKLPARMSKRIKEHSDDSLRQSSRKTKGQKPDREGFVDPRYIDFDNDDELSNNRKQYEFDE
jgi:hypothetical protein